MTKKVYLSPENRLAPHGLYTGYPGVYEHDVCCEIAAYEKAELERCGFSVTIASPGTTLAQRVSAANAGKFDFYQTVHTNAGGGTGAECLYFDHAASKNANQLIYNELTKLYPSKRGLKNGMGYYENTNTNMVSAYPEIAFHDNASDAKYIVNNKKEIARALAKGVCNYFNVDYIEQSSTPRAPDYSALLEELKTLIAKYGG